MHSGNPVSTPAASAAGARPLYGWQATALKLAWTALAGTVLVLLVYSAPHYFDLLRDRCIDLVCDVGPTPPPGSENLARLGISEGAYAAYYAALDASVSAGYLLVSLAIFLFKPRDRIAVLGSFALVLWGSMSASSSISVISQSPTWRPWFELAQFSGLAAFTLFFYLFPNGRFEPRWIRPFGLFLAAAFLPGFLWPGTSLDYRGWPPALAAPLLVGLLGSIIYVQGRRLHRTADAAGRRQTKWVVFGVVTALAGFFTLVSLPAVLRPSLHEDANVVLNMAINTGGALFMLMIPASLAVAILRHRLWDIDVLIHRSLVYSTLTLLVGSLYVAVVSGVGRWVPSEGHLLVSLSATAVVAVVFAPLRAQLQRRVNRLLYGDRDDPYAVLSRLSRHLESSISPTMILPTLATTVQTAMRVPYVGVVARGGDGSPPSDETVTLAESGRTVPERHAREVLPIRFGGEVLGELVVAARAPDELFSQGDRQLLEDLARQAGQAIHTVQLLNHLQRSRARLVVAREEERRRLRNDLHDDLGPRLSGLVLKLETARSGAAHDAATAARLATLADDARSVIREIRRIVHALRPAILDELGLAAALEEFVDSFSRHRPEIGLELAKDLPPLSAALELAVFRTAQEALTNVVRHADAHACRVRLRRDGATHEIVLAVEDDGIGIDASLARRERDAIGRSPSTTASPTRGVGLASMRERVAELGGVLAVSAGANGGTLVQARFPVKSA